VVRFIHTADWQLGKRGGFAGELGERLARARLEAVRRILDLAREERADFIVVAGDAFESHQVSRKLLHEVQEILRTSPCPVYLLPGNHDPLVPESIYRLREEWRQMPDHVHLLDKPEPVPAGPATLFPCPCTSRWSHEDPTTWIPPRLPSHGIRVGVAHGTWNVPAVGDGGDRPIPLDAALARDLDYLALGHIHAGPTAPEDIVRWRTAYPGTPEPADFGDEEAGYVLVVSIDAPGATPAVKRLCVASTCRKVLDWIAPANDPSGDLRYRLSVLPEPDRTVLRLRARGAVSHEDLSRVKNVIEELEPRFLHLDADLSGLEQVADDLDLERLLTPLLLAVARRLRAYAEGASASDFPSLALANEDYAPPVDVPATAHAALHWLQFFATKARKGEVR
jgi:DNA repair exonuclease SbcCD nuclease subunit